MYGSPTEMDCAPKRSTPIRSALMPVQPPESASARRQDIVRTGLGRPLLMVVSGCAALAVVASAGAATRPTTARVVSSAQNAKLGAILVADTTVYTLKATKPGCIAACMQDWPPVLLPHGVK